MKEDGVKGSDDRKDYFVHPTACVDEGACVGKGTRIWHFSHVMPGALIGENCNLGQNVYIGPDVVIGNGVKIQNNVSVYDRVRMEDDVFCGPSMVFTNVVNPRSHVSRKHEFKETLVGRGATMGANCTIVCGNVIGRFAFVGAGAVITRDVPPHGLVYGVPARLRGWMCACGVRLDFPEPGEDEKLAVCRACGASYSKEGLVVSRVDGAE